MDSPCYAQDIYPRHVLYAITIRSPVAKGRLTSIECPKLPNYYTLVTAADIPGINRLEETALPILANDSLSYIGEPVALLLGPDKAKLEEYSSQCKVIAEKEEPVFSYPEASDEMILFRREILSGDKEEALANAPNMVRSDFFTGIQDHWYAEPVGALTWLEENKTESRGKKPEKILVVRAATQWPFHVKRSLIQALKLDSDTLRIVPCITGLHMDGKLWYPSLVACHAALGTIITGKPVRLILTREEDFRFSPKRCESRISIASALNEKGNIMGTDMHISVNLGAFGVNGEEILDQTCIASHSFYHFNRIKLLGQAFRTNIPPAGPFSGFGMSQGLFALESHVSQIADILKQNPAEWRKSNLNTGSTLLHCLSARDFNSAEKLLDTVTAMSTYNRKWASYELLRQNRRGKTGEALAQSGLTDWLEEGENLRGIGIALGFQGNGLLYPGADKGSYGIEITLTKESDLEINTSMTGSCDDFAGLWAGIAAEILSIEPHKVHIVYGIKTPDSGPSCASRNITALTKLVEKCCMAIRKQRFRDPLPITIRRSVKAQSSAAWKERFPPPDGKLLDTSGFSLPGQAAAVVEVAIDSVELIPKIRGVWLAVDGGKIISEDRARRSLAVSTAGALGWAFAEHIEYTDGVLSQSQFENYSIPGPADIPPIFIDFLWNDSQEPRGIGELPFNCIPAAFLQAVSQAMDHRFNSIPLKPEDIWEAGKLKKTEKTP